MNRFVAILKGGKCPKCGSSTLAVKHGKLKCDDCGHTFTEKDVK